MLRQIVNSTEVVYKKVAEAGFEDLPEREVQYAETFKIAKRRAEYLTSRQLVYSKLSLSSPLDRTSNGLIKWPPYLIGSITHSRIHACFASVCSRVHWGLGIDIEEVARMKKPLATKILGSDELETVKSACANEDDFRKYLTVAFTAKEALFKCHYPTGQRKFYFHDVQIQSLDVKSKSLSMKLAVQTSDLSPAGHIANCFWFDGIDGEILSVVKERNVEVCRKRDE